MEVRSMVMGPEQISTYNPSRPTEMLRPSTATVRSLERSDLYRKLVWRPPQRCKSCLIVNYPLDTKMTSKIVLLSGRFKLFSTTVQLLGSEHSWALYARPMTVKVTSLNIRMPFFYKIYDCWHSSMGHFKLTLH